MARGEPPDAGPPLGERPPLPAPYRSPWRGLAEALGAVAADLRLRLQRLWRRNREADLPLPRLWPARLAPLFWPLLLGLVVAVLAGLAALLLNRAGAVGPATSAAGDTGATATPAASQRLRSRPGLVAPADGSLADGSHADGSPADGWPADDGPAAAAEPEAWRPEPELKTGAGAAAPGGQGLRGAGEPASPGLRSDDTPGAGPQPGAGTGPDAGPTGGLQLDPLLELLAQGEDADLLLAARPDPSGARLSLTLSSAAEALPQAELLQRAQRWQQRARDAGYERLELRDRQGRLRGRGALVGSGMILLAPVSGS